jgi:hypothetical protein
MSHLRNLKGFLRNLKGGGQNRLNSFAQSKGIFAQSKGCKHLMIGGNCLCIQQKFAPKNAPISHLDHFLWPSELNDLARALARPASN